MSDDLIRARTRLIISADMLDSYQRFMPERIPDALEDLDAAVDEYVAIRDER